MGVFLLALVLGSFVSLQCAYRADVLIGVWEHLLLE